MEEPQNTEAVRVILGLGTNLGDRLGFLSQAIGQLTDGDAPSLTDIMLSSIYESKALLPENAPTSWDISYYNMAVSGVTQRTPEEMLTHIKAIEHQLGRRPSDRWSPREIDIDILAWGDVVMDTPLLTIPHKGVLERDFVLLPIADIAPKWCYPVLGKDYSRPASQLAERFKNSTDITKTSFVLSLKNEATT